MRKRLLRQIICWVLIAMAGTCFPALLVGSRASIFSTLLLVVVITVLGTVVGVFCGWHGRVDGHGTHAHIRYVSGVSRSGVRTGGGRLFRRRTAKRNHRAGGDLVAEIALLARSQTLAQKETVWMKAAKLSGSSTQNSFSSTFCRTSSAPFW